ncbi:hypothetical protein MK489_14270 [Myxococcota bacterium]|nr:hypothetical protein [Myxococcota bacterium]
MKIRQLVGVVFFVCTALLASGVAFAYHHTQENAQDGAQNSQVTVNEALELPTDPDDADDIRDDNDPEDIGQSALENPDSNESGGGGAPSNR